MSMEKYYLSHESGLDYVECITDIVMVESDFFGTDLICPICGASYININKGRTKEYCSDNCRDFSKYLNAMERALLKIDFKGKTSNFTKGQLFRIANNIRCV